MSAFKDSTEHSTPNNKTIGSYAPLSTMSTMIITEAD